LVQHAGLWEPQSFAPARSGRAPGTKAGPLRRERPPQSGPRMVLRSPTPPRRRLVDPSQSSGPPIGGRSPRDGRHHPPDTGSADGRNDHPFHRPENAVPKPGGDHPHPQGAGRA